MSDYGTVTVMTVPGGIRVTEADARTAIAPELYDQACAGELEHVVAGEGLFRIEALNGQWTYALTGEVGMWGELIAERRTWAKP